MGSWRENLSKAVQDDDEALAAAKQDEEAEEKSERQNRELAIAVLQDVVVPALEELREELNKAGRTVEVTSRLKGFSSPHVEAILSRPDREPVTISIVVQPMSHMNVVMLKTGQGQGAEHSVLHSGLEGLTTESVIEEVLKAYTKSLKARP
jgi:hypothetical protein